MIMMNEIEDEVMVKPANTSNTNQTVHRENAEPRSRVPSHQESYSLHGTPPLSEAEFEHLSALSSLVLDAPDVNHARVESIKREILSGRYQISSNQIAMRMMANS